MPGEWETRLVFDACADAKVFVVSWLCGPCNLAYQKAAVDETECGIGTLIPILCCGLCCAFTVRKGIREKYDIEGSAAMDLLSILYCGVCAVAQQTRELDRKGAKPAGMCMEE